MVIEDGSIISPYGWSADGALLFEYGAANASADIGVLPVDGDGTWKPLLETEAAEQAPAVSPDGRWIAYDSDRTGTREVYVQRFPELGGEQLISRGGGIYPVWSSDGRELFYQRPGTGLMVAPVEPGANLRVGIAEPLFDVGTYYDLGLSRSWDVSPDGQQLLMIRLGSGGDHRGRRPDRDHPGPELVRGTHRARPRPLAMSLTPGTTLGPYAVTAKIGEGGMGEVYRARDTKLDRDVALKVLPEAFTQDPDRLARFEREAKVLASLNHPNIAAIYGLEEADGTRAFGVGTRRRANAGRSHQARPDPPRRSTTHRQTDR